MKYFKYLFLYSGKYYLLSLVLFIAFWHFYSVALQLNYIIGKIEMLSNQNAAILQDFYIKNDLIEMKKVLWSVKGDEIQSLEFESLNTHPVMQKIVIGNVYDYFGIIKRSLHVVSSGAVVGEIKYFVNAWELNYNVLSKNGFLFIMVTVFMLFLLFLSNVGSIKSIIGLEQSFNKFDFLAGKHDVNVIDCFIKEQSSIMPVKGLSKSYFGVLNKFLFIFRKVISLEKKLVENERLAAIGQLSAELAHDLKAPSAGILMMLNVIRDNQSVTPEMKEILTGIEGDAIKIKKLVNDLNDYSKAEKLNLISASPKTLEEIFSDSVAVLKRKSKHILFSLNNEATFNTIEIDAEKIRRVIDNILNNSCEAIAESGKVDIRISNSNQKTVKIEIADTGKGIDEDSLKHVFEPYFTKDKKYGTGLGLAICRKLIDLHKGEISIESKVGVGTKMMIEI